MTMFFSRDRLFNVFVDDWIIVFFSVFQFGDGVVLPDLDGLWVSVFLLMFYSSVRRWTAGDIDQHRFRIILFDAHAALNVYIQKTVPAGRDDPVDFRFECTVEIAMDNAHSTNSPFSISS